MDTNFVKEIMERSRSYRKWYMIAVIVALLGVALSGYSIRWIVKDGPQCETFGAEDEEAEAVSRVVQQCRKWSSGRVITLVLVCLVALSYVTKAHTYMSVAFSGP